MSHFVSECGTVESARSQSDGGGFSRLSTVRRGGRHRPRNVRRQRLWPRAFEACIRWSGLLVRALAAKSVSPRAEAPPKQLRIIALTNLGAIAAFDPATGTMDFGRPLVEHEQLLACVIQLIDAGWPLPIETLGLNPQTLRSALGGLKWAHTAALADSVGLELAVPAELHCVRQPLLRPGVLISCRYQCSCGSRWTSGRGQVDEERCPICFTPCLPARSSCNAEFG